MASLLVFVQSENNPNALAAQPSERTRYWIHDNGNNTFTAGVSVLSGAVTRSIPLGEEYSSLEAAKSGAQNDWNLGTRP